MAIEELYKDQLYKLTEAKHSVVLFYANGCKHCNTAKSYFEDIQIQYPNVKILKADINELMDHYIQYAELTPDVVYELGEEVDGVQTTKEVQQLNDDGTLKMIPKLVFPSFYVYAKEEVSESNPYGFVGAFDSANPEEAYAVVEQLSLISV